MEFMDVIRNRKSVRSYIPQPVEDEKLEQVLEAGRLAPSWANKQCWHYIVVTSAEAKKKLAGAGGLTNNWLKQAPVVIIACADPSLSGSRNGIDYFAVDVAISLEHMVLAAADLGLGTCWIGYFNEDKIKNALNIPDDIRVVALTPLGYPKGSGIRDRLSRAVIGSSYRKPVDEIAHYNDW